MKQLLVALLAATFALSVSAGKPSKEQIDPGVAERQTEQGADRQVQCEEEREGEEGMRTTVRYRGK